MDIETLISDSGISIGTLTLSIVLRGVLILVVGLIAVKVILKAVEKALGRSKSLATISNYILSAARILLYTLLVLVVLGSLGVEVTSFVALLSILGIAVSLALQNTLSNTAGGMMVLISKPFVVGDYISVDGVEGKVEAIGLSYCTVVTVDNRKIFIPNAQISAAKVINFNCLGRRRVDLTVSASYDAPTAEVKAAIGEAMAGFPQILSTPAPAVYLSEYGSSAISYIVRMWVKAEDYWDVYFGMLEAIRDAFDAHNVEMTYDHLNVHMVQE